MKKLIFLLLLFAAFSAVLANSVEAKEAAYLVVSGTNTVHEHITTLNNLGFNVTIITSSNIATTDFTRYDLLLINNENFPTSTEGLIPVRNYPSLILTRYNTDLTALKWSEGAIGYMKTTISTANIYDQNHYITQGTPVNFQPYTQAGLYYYYIWRSRSAPGIRQIANREDSLNPVIGTVSPGSLMRGGVISNAKNVYFGFTEHQFWSTDTKRLFERSIIWLTTDFDAPIITNLSVNNITNISATLNWNTNKISNVTLRYGKTELTQQIYREEFLAGSQNLQITGLEELTTYNYTLEVCNINGYCNTTSINSFNTLDITAPMLLETNVENITNTSAKIIALFNEESNYTLFYSHDLEIYETISSTEFSTTATETVTPLNEKTKYYYYFQLCDIHSNCINTEIYNFTTDDETAPNAPANVKIEADNLNNYVRLTWDIPDGEIPTYYNIYISNDGLFDFSSSSATVTNTEFIDYEANSDQNKYYIIRSVDDHNNEEDNEFILMKTTLNIIPGISSYSIPIKLQNNSIKSIFYMNESFSPLKEVRIYNTATQQLEIYTFDKEEYEWSEDVEINTLEGFFLLSYHYKDWIIVGEPITAFEINLEQGMNLLGLTLTNNKEVYDFASSTITEISKRNYDDGIFRIATKYNSDWDNQYNITINPKVGYWIKSDETTTLMVN